MSENDSSSRLEQLRFARCVVELQARAQLEQIDGWIAMEQRRENERRRGEQARPPVPECVIEVGIGVGKAPVAVHMGGCPMSGKRLRPIARDQAVRALAEGIEPCTHCRPDTDLGVLD